MLIRFRVSNFLSFKEEIEFSMIPGKTRQHLNHIESGGKSRYDIDLLRAAIIYGANASGKSNLVKAIKFAQDLILEGVQARKTIPIKPFKLDKSLADQTSKFEFELHHRGKNYLYGFEVDADRVYAEWLYELRKTTEALLFERQTAKGKKTIVDFSNLKNTNKKEREFLEFVAMGTRPNQLFLTESIERNVQQFEDVYDWFANVLQVIFPGSRYLNFDVQNAETQMIVNYLDQFGTGVCGFDIQPVSPDAEIPNQIIEDMTKKLEPGKSIALMVTQTGQRYWVSKNEQQELSVNKLMLKHKMGNCDEETLFEIDEESDGTIRLMDLIPILTMPEERARVTIIDELDRSLHPNLCYQLIDKFLNKEGKNQQLVVTTHESNLLTFDLLRRDEIWFVEKNQQGASVIYSLEEFTPRYDKDIHKGYLLGRFGAIPIIGKKSF